MSLALITSVLDISGMVVMTVLQQRAGMVYLLLLSDHQDPCKCCRGEQGGKQRVISSKLGV